MNGEVPPPETAPETGFHALPGDLMMWVLILSELAVFGAGLLAFLTIRLTDPAGFAAARAHLDAAGAGANTVVLVSSGWLAALAGQAAGAGRRAGLRLYLAGAALLGMLFLWIKGLEYAAKAAWGITFETHPFFMFYYLLTGFHAAHVVAGILILGLVAWNATPRVVETGAAFWHMVDLVWVLLFPIVYLIG